MGDRANVVILDSSQPQDGAVYLYTHWGGESLPQMVECALKKFPNRWDDQQYLARIVFDVMTQGRNGEETGFGISATLFDNEHQLIALDCRRGQLFVAGESEPLFDKCHNGHGIPFSTVTADAIREAGYE